MMASFGRMLLIVSVWCTLMLMGCTQKTPNILIFIADDLGMGDVGILGNKTLRTPNIDAIGREGAVLSHHLAAASVCTPSRAAFLTSRYPIRNGMTPTNIVRVNMFVSSMGGLPPEEITLAELLKDRGYKTGYIGKWHLGHHCSNADDFCHSPPKQGFDHFYGVPLTNLKDFGDDGDSVVYTRVPYIDEFIYLIMFLGVLLTIILARANIIGKVAYLILLAFFIFVPLLAMWIYKNLKIQNSILMRNYEVVEQPIRLKSYLAQRLAGEAVDFLKERQKDQDPFMLMVSWMQVHTAMHASPRFEGVSAHGKYGDNVEELDWSTGYVMEELRRLGFDDNTFVYFSSDNGGHVDEKGLEGDIQGGYNGIYRGGKSMGGMEGGIRVPTFVRWPGVIPAGQDITVPTSQMDLLPTIAFMTGAKVPTDRQIDGRNIYDLLTGKSSATPHQFLFHYCGPDIHAARYAPVQSTDVWKVHFVYPVLIPGTQGCGFICDCFGRAVEVMDPPLMYNIAKDPGENNLLDVTQPEYARLLDIIKEAIEVHKSAIASVPNQMSAWNMLPIPWLQPCCGQFPACNCEDNRPIPGHSQEDIYCKVKGR